MKSTTRSAFLALIVLSAGPAWAQSAVSDWTVDGPNVPHTPNTTFNVDLAQKGSPDQQLTVWAAGDTVTALWTKSGAPAWKYKVTGATVSRFPVVVPLADGQYYVIFTATNGRVYKINANNTNPPSGVVSRDLRRGLGCFPDDSLVATPTVMLRAYAPALPDDLIIVPTFHGCGDHSLNQVIGLNASNLSDAWRFNEWGEYQVDYFSEGCSLDYPRGVAYCGSNLQPGRTQNTLWAIYVAGANAGTLKWASNANSVRNRPQLGFPRADNAPEHLYVADQLGVLHAYDPASGAEHWQLPVTGIGTEVVQNVWAEFRPPYQNVVFMTDSAGALHAVYDGYLPSETGGEAFELWTHVPIGAKVMSLGTVSPTLGKLYVGYNDGSVHQLALATGADEAMMLLLAKKEPGNIVTDPTLHIQGAEDINRMVVSTYGVSARTKQYPVPFTVAVGTELHGCTPTAAELMDPNAENPNCAKVLEATGQGALYRAPKTCVPGQAGNDCCSIARCDPKGKFCYAAAKDPAKVGACTDGKSCTGDDRCHAGTCTGSKWVCAPNDKNCSNDPRSCGPGKMCYRDGVGAPWECLDLNGGNGSREGWKACGTVSRSCESVDGPSGTVSWGGERICIKGRCQRNENICGSIASPATIMSKGASDWMSSLTFDRTTAGCSAWTTQYRATSQADINKVFRVSPGGTVSQKTPDMRPGFMNGIIVHDDNSSAIDFLTTFVNRPSSLPHGQMMERAGVGYGGASSSTFISLNANTKPSIDIEPAPVGCMKAGCQYPFRLVDYNYGPTPPASYMQSSNNIIFYGNYRTNGDVYGLIKTTSGDFNVQEFKMPGAPLLPTPGAAAVHGEPGPTRCVRDRPKSGAQSFDCPADLPTCVASVCTATCADLNPCKAKKTTKCYIPAGQSSGYCVQKTCTQDSDCAGLANGATSCVKGLCAAVERVTAVSVADRSKPFADDIVRIAVGPRIFFADYRGKPPMTTWVDLTIPLAGGGAGHWATKGFQYVKAITSMVVDPLSRTGDLYLAVREERPSAQCGGTWVNFVHVRGDDHAVRPLGHYTDLACKKSVPGALEEFGSTLLPKNIDAKLDARVTASSQQRMHVWYPVDPATAATNPDRIVRIEEFKLLP